MQTSKGHQNLVDVLWRSLVIGGVYALAHTLAAATLGALSRQTATMANGMLWWLTGTLLALTLAPFVLRSTWSKRDTILAVWAAIGLIRSLGTGMEGSLFRPAEGAVMRAGFITDVLIGLFMAWLAVRMFLPSQRETGAADSAGRPWWSWAWRVALVGVAYFVFYFVFGAANAFLYTLRFYENNPQYGLNLPPTGTIFMAQMIRGPLFALGSLFLVRASSMARRQTTIWLGLLLFILGGFGPYVENTFRLMPLGFSLATLTEIFLQNFCTGLVAARLYKTPPRPSP